MKTKTMLKTTETAKGFVNENPQRSKVSKLETIKIQNALSVLGIKNSAPELYEIIDAYNPSMIQLSPLNRDIYPSIKDALSASEIDKKRKAVIDAYKTLAKNYKSLPIVESLPESSSTELAIAEFPRILEIYSRKSSESDLEEKLSDLMKLSILDNEVYYNSPSIQEFLDNGPDVRKGFKEIVENYLSASLSTKFPLISDELFKLRRYLTFYKNNGRWQLVRDNTEKSEEPLFEVIVPKKPTEPLKPKEPVYQPWDYPPKKIEKVIRNGWIQIKFVNDEEKYQEEIKRYERDLQRYNKKYSIHIKDKGFYESQKEKKESVRKNTTLLEIPLFIYTPLFERALKKIKLGEFLDSFRVERRDQWEEKYNKKIFVETKLPGIIGSDLKEAYREALIHYFGVLSAMFENPVAGDVLYQQRELLKPEIGAIWIPTPESLGVSTKDELVYRRNLDPAMTLRVANKSYLVKTWNVNNEEPFEQYLKEYMVRRV